MFYFLEISARQSSVMNGQLSVFGLQAICPSGKELKAILRQSDTSSNAHMAYPLFRSSAQNFPGGTLVASSTAFWHLRPSYAGDPRRHSEGPAVILVLQRLR